MSNLIQELEGDNLCTYFVLPLLKLNKSSFISSNFINSYMAYDCRTIVVRIYDSTLVSRQVFVHPDYYGTFVKGGDNYLCFKIPKRWLNDARLYRQGLYSRVSDAAKDTIRQWSGLPYRHIDQQGKLKTDGRLMALIRQVELKRALENALGVTFGPDEELLAKPSEDCFIEL